MSDNEKVDVRTTIENMHQLGGVAILVIVFVTGNALRMIFGIWRVEDVLTNIFCTGMVFWLIAAGGGLRSSAHADRLEFVRIGRKMLKRQFFWWAFWNLLIGFFATMVFFPHGFVADTAFVFCRYNEGMPLLFVVFTALIFLPFTIGYPLAIVLMDKVVGQKKGEEVEK